VWHRPTNRWSMWSRYQEPDGVPALAPCAAYFRSSPTRACPSATISGLVRLGPPGQPKDCPLPRTARGRRRELTWRVGPRITDGDAEGPSALSKEF
jgi:hypothetical protein